MHGTTLCSALFGLAFLDAVSAATGTLPEKLCEHYSELLTLVDVSGDEAALLQAGSLNLRSMTHDHEDYAPAKDEHDYYEDADPEGDYYGSSYDYAHSTAKGEYNSHYRSSEYGNGDNGNAVVYRYIQDNKHNQGDSYGTGKYGKYEYYGEKGDDANPKDGKYYGEMKDYGHAKAGEYHGKLEDDGYAQQKQYYSKVGEYEYAKDSTKEYYDVNDYTYTKEGKDEYGDHVLLQVAGLNQAAGDVHSKMYRRRYEDSGGKQDEYIDHSRKGRVNDFADTKVKHIKYYHPIKKGKPDKHVHRDEQQFDESDKAVHRAYAKKHTTTTKYDRYSGQDKEERYAHARKTYKYYDNSGKHKEDDAAYPEVKTDHRDAYFRNGKARDYADAKQKKTKYDDYLEQGKSGNYPAKNTKYNDYSGQPQGDIGGLLKGIFKGLSKGDSYAKKDIKYDDHSRQDQADVKQLLNGIFKRLSKDDPAHAQQKTAKYAAKQIADKFAKRKKAVLGRVNKYWNLHKWGLRKGVFRGNSKEDMSQHYDHPGKRMEASKGHAKTTAYDDEADDYRRADKHGGRKIAGSELTKNYLLSHQRDRHHRFSNGRWLRGRLGHWRYLADAKEKATKHNYREKLKESSYSYAKQSKTNLDSYSGVGKDSKGKRDDYSDIGMADDYVDANTLTIEHGDYSGK